MNPAVRDRFQLSFRAKLQLAFAAGGLVAAFLLFLAGNYYVNALQKRNVKAAVDLAQEQARQLSRDIIDLLREEKQDSLRAGDVPRKLRPLTQVVLRQNRKIVWAGIFDPATGTYVVEQSGDDSQTFRTNAIGNDAYRSEIPVGHRQPMEVSVNTVNPAGETREIHHVIEQNGKPVGEIRLRLADSESFDRIEATSQQITRALVLQAALLLVVFVVVFLAVWRLVARHLEVVARAARLSQMAYVGTLASGLAHEIRNPLNAMSINLELAEEELAEHDGEHPQVRQLLKRVRSEVHQLNGTLSSFLEFALPTRESVTRFPVLAVVNELLDGHRAQLAELGVTCDVDSPPAEQTVVEADRRLLHQCLRNIFLNAVQAVSNSVPRLVEIHIARAEEYLRIEVRDSGPGIPEEHLPHVFEAFYTTRKGGTGLGLAIARKIVEEHGGTIEAANATPRGARFTIQIPLEARVSA
jgi:signal transduction histidine kinase